jgi:hypothetical protein
VEPHHLPKLHAWTFGHASIRQVHGSIAGGSFDKLYVIGGVFVNSSAPASAAVRSPLTSHVHKTWNSRQLELGAECDDLICLAPASRVRQEFSLRRNRAGLLLTFHQDGMLHAYLSSVGFASRA